MLKSLKEKVLKANQDLVRYNLVTLTWGNVSGIDRKKELIAIKPSGVDYNKLRIQDIVILHLIHLHISNFIKPFPVLVESLTVIVSMQLFLHKH
jgi:L-ribulose-5-phosphate 4-epimerase